ncbi:MAG: NAD(P)/FAD-dependent oxidoreductase [Bacteroidota bacterium]
MEPIDLLVVGAGPAGLSAAITARRRNKSVSVVSKEEISYKLQRAHRVDNYPGIPAVSGQDLAGRLRTHAELEGTAFHLDEIQSLAAETSLLVAFGRNEEYRARAVVLAPGVSQHQAIPGEGDLLGRGVSYCATCDAMFFRGRPVAVVAYLPAALEEALFLAEVCSQVYYFPQYRPFTGHDRLTVVPAKPLAIEGQTAVNAILTDAGRYEVAAVFVEREALPMERLMPGLAVADGFVSVDRRQQTNVPGVFAAGDCTGRPWQIARAIGEGQVAALSAVDFLAGLEKIGQGAR